VGISSRLAGPFRTWSAYRALKAARRSADEQLLASRLPSPRLAWRVAELTSQEHRVELGRSLTNAVRAADERLLPNATSLDRSAVRECRPQLLDIAARLFDLERSVTPRGMLLVDGLLSDGGSPLYGHDAPRRLRLELMGVQAALDGSDT
jgi:hypothetical protein